MGTTELHVTGLPGIPHIFIAKPPVSVVDYINLLNCFVGINTSVPVERLTVNGNINHDSDSQFNYLGGANDVGDTFDGNDLVRDYDLLDTGTADYRIQANSENRLVVLAENVLQSYGGRRRNKRTVSSNTVLNYTDEIVQCNTNGGAFNITYPAGVTGTQYTIKNAGTSGNIVTIIPNGAEAIDERFLSDGESYQQIYDSIAGWLTI